MERKEKMTRFDVLNRHTKINSHMILEASAGTGKTFSIENLVVRLLVEGEKPLKIDQILIVTFTKMATSDLRIRVRDNIENAANALETGTIGRFDYLEPFLDDEEKRKGIIQLLERALIGFDESQIFTIHGFCHRMLSEHGMDGYINPDPKNEGKGIGEEKYKKCVLDYFRTGLSSESVGFHHRKFALNAFIGVVENLEKKLGEIIASGVEIAKTPSRNELYVQFGDCVERLKKVHRLEPDKLKSDLEHFIPSMKKKNGYDGSGAMILCEFIEKDEVNDADFERMVEVGPSLLPFLHPDNKKVKFPPDDTFHYPDLPEILNRELKQFKYKNYGIARMAYECQKLMHRQFDEEELRSFDDLLEVMRQKLKGERFLKAVRARYRAVVVDEFQDTDPRQWEIFKRAFPPDESGWGHLYLVGDPKQSIYAFRQADIYTYLEAAEAIGQQNLYSLDTNYRSQPSLVKGLNHLFGEPFTEGWIPLPKLNTFMNVPRVQWDNSKEDRDFNDDRSALHICIHQSKTFNLIKSEEEAFFPFLVQEIQRLRKEPGINLGSFAVLVADRHQAKRTSQYLKRWNIPSQRQRVEPISESPVIASMRELLYGIYHYRDESALKIALGGLFIRWSCDDISKLKEDSVYAEVQERFRSLEHTWQTDGLSVCMENLLESRWHDGTETVLERILKEENGDQFYADFQHVIELMLEKPRTPSEALLYLERFSFDISLDEEELKRRFDIGLDSVQIITIHSSKGLEYDIVFALGLVKRSRKKDLYYISEGNLKFIFDPDNKELVNYINESDSEKMRHLYVACTRPKYRLYLPYIDTKVNPSLGILSPMELFVNKFSVPFDQFLKMSSDNQYLSYNVLNDFNFELEKSETVEIPELSAPELVEVNAEPMTMTSFSAMAQVSSSEQSEAPHQFEQTEKTPSTLPAGSMTGTLLHKLLEEIPFVLGREWSSFQDAVPYVAPYTKGTDYEEWTDVLSEIVYHAITTPFVNGTALKDLDPGHLKFEAEFLYPYISNTFVKGFIDLVFSSDGKFFVLDWKSNWLGNAFEDYSEDCLDLAMSHHDYFKQAEIYSEALKKYLTISTSKPFSEIFGGVYYVFLRGLPKNGVKYIPPSFS